MICKPDFSVSTKSAYQKFSFENKKNYNFQKVLDSVNRGDILGYSNSKFNVLEDVVSKEYTEIKEIEKVMYDLGCNAAMMTGSGSAVFGIFKDKSSAEKACGSLKKYKCFLTNFI